ncbi:transcriptional activator domain-containing protein [Modicisalibacter muralis]|uniref:Transcriptional activator domain-containing protein n=1 Tax=Modicisalibacter muralis TaxID=119000 RepID=A0A1G9GSP1_9GAMM|nr:AAA family ATPase [Halomonas muralis]SDL03634.1 transcriptional activator domain-containing protein [Halomonas muralis]
MPGENTGTDIGLLGRFEVRRGGVLVPLPPSRKSRALLAFLVLAGEPVRRERLCELFFETPADPRAALRWCLSKLRPLVDDTDTARLIAQCDHIAFAADDVDVDVFVYRQLVGGEPEQAETDTLEEAARRYRGVLLEDIDLPECHRFAAWLTGERERLDVLHDRVLATLVRRLHDRPERALEWAGTRLRLNPYAEEAHADVMDSLVRLGRRDEALKQFRRCSRMLAEELGLKPSQTLREAYARLSAGQSGAPVVRQTGDDLPALVGRHKETAALRTWLAEASAAAEPEVLWLHGEPGIGKSRLLAELAAMTGDTGGQTLAGRGFEVETTRPQGAWIDLLSAIPRPRIPEYLRAVLAPLRPELDTAGSAPIDRNLLFATVAELLATLATTAAPLVILFDDVQWLDKASISLLHYVIRTTAGRGVLFACAARPSELETNAAAQKLTQALRHDGRLRDLDIPAMSAEDTRALVCRLDPELDTELVYRHSQGNPLFALEVARAMQRGALELSRTLDTLIGDRLAGLDAQTSTLLPWAAALGHDFDLERLGEVCDLSAPALLTALGILEKRRIFKVSDNGRYDFNHDLIREAAYQQVSQPCRRVIHARIAQTLATRQIDAEANELVRHAILADDPAMAARAAVAAGRYGLSIFGYEEVSAQITRGISLLDRLLETQRLEREAELLELWVHPGMAPYRPDDLQARLLHLVKQARLQRRPTLLAHCFYLLANIHYQTGDTHHAIQRAFNAETAGRDADPVTVVRAIADCAKCLGMLQRDMPRVRALALEAQALAAELDNQFYEIPLALGLAHQHAGQWRRAHQCYEQALALARNSSDHWWEVYCLSRLPLLELERGRPQAVTPWCEELVPLAEKMGLDSETALAHALGALAGMALLAADAEPRLNAALAQLRSADSQWLLAQVQIFGAGCDLAAGRYDAAEQRAGEALTAARIVDQRSEMALAQTLLAELAWRAGDGETARAQLDAVAPDFADRPLLSHRARRAYTDARRRLSETALIQR